MGIVVWGLGIMLGLCGLGLEFGAWGLMFGTLFWGVGFWVLVFMFGGLVFGVWGFGFGAEGRSFYFALKPGPVMRLWTSQNPRR